MSKIPKLILCGVTLGKVISSPPATSCAPYNLTQEHRRTNAHMEKLECLGFRTHLSLCLNLSRPLSIQRFTENAGCNLAEQPMSYDNLVTFCIRSAKKKRRLYDISRKYTADVLPVDIWAVFHTYNGQENGNTPCIKQDGKCAKWQWGGS